MGLVGVGCLVAGARATYWDPDSPTCDLSSIDTAVRTTMLTVVASAVFRITCSVL